MINEGKKTIWKNYQKEIADDKYFYVRSCVRQNFFPGAEATFLRIMKEELKKDYGFDVDFARARIMPPIPMMGA